MGTLFQAQKPMRQLDFWHIIQKSFFYTTPCFSMLKRGPKIKEIESSWPIESLLESSNPKAKEDENLENRAVSSNVDKVLSNTMMRFVSKRYKLTEFAEALPSHLEKGVTPLGKQRTKCLQAFNLSIARMICSDFEAIKNAENVAPQTRTIGNWLSRNPHAIFPVDEYLRPVAGGDFDMTEFTEEQFREALMQSAIQMNSTVNLTAFVGLQLKQHMSMWTSKVPASADIQSRINVNVDANANKFKNIVDVFEFDSGIVRLFNDNQLYAKHTGETDLTIDPAISGWSGMFLNMAMWDMQFLRDISHHETRDDGSGKGGLFKAIARLRCLNTQAQFGFKHTPAAPAQGA